MTGIAAVDDANAKSETVPTVPRTVMIGGVLMSFADLKQLNETKKANNHTKQRNNYGEKE